MVDCRVTALEMVLQGKADFLQILIAVDAAVVLKGLLV
jgi:hypothetical protein